MTMSGQTRGGGSRRTNADQNRRQAQASRELAAILTECPELPPIAWAVSPGGHAVTGTVSGLPTTDQVRGVFGAWRDALGLEEIPAEATESGRVTWLRARTVRAGVRLTLTAWVYEDDADSNPAQVPEPRLAASRRQAGGAAGLLPPRPPDEPGPVHAR